MSWSFSSQHSSKARLQEARNSARHQLMSLTPPRYIAPDAALSSQTLINAASRPGSSAPLSFTLSSPSKTAAKQRRYWSSVNGISPKLPFSLITLPPFPSCGATVPLRLHLQGFAAPPSPFLGLAPP